MKVNPGGILSSSEVVGRDRLIQKLWRILDRQSVVLTAERRMGKTSIVKKMVVQVPDTTIAIYRDLEGIKTASGFVKRVLEDVEAYLSGFQKSAVKVRALLKSLKGAEISGVKLPEIPETHWNDVLQRTMEDLLEHQDCPVIFFWDELPLMLYDIKQQQGESVAQEILDVLRSLRQTHPNLRMVFTGSIGLHNVLTTLKRAGYANDPTNDMKIVDVPPLAQADAEDLARQLFVGEGLMVEMEKTAQEIASAADYIPFFIHQLVDHLVLEEGASVDVPGIVKQYMLDPQDPWHLRYYRERIDVYYLDDDKVLALALLDVLALASEPLSFDEIYNRVLSQTDAFDDDIESARDVLTLLQRDHYIQQVDVNAYAFRFALIQQSWMIHRGLAT